MGYVAHDNIARMYSQAAEDITAFLDGAPILVLNA